MNIFHIDSAESTNSLLASLAPQIETDCIIAARQQTAGRGQRGNTWESAPGQNITMSALLHVAGIAAAEQFYISEAVALAVAATLDIYIDPARVTVKWPNDIYVDDRKIAGILIEHSLTGSGIDHTIAGIGLNVNQTEFLSDAPNPVSIAMVTGRTFDTREVLDRLADNLEAMTCDIDRDDLHRRYLARLWRRDGLHRFAEPGGATFDASIDGVAPTGHLTLDTPAGPRTYAFKEIAFVL